MWFDSKTFIQNKNITKEQEAEYRQKIQKWLEDISKVKYCKELLDVVTQCEALKIIFDFESELVDNAALYDRSDPGLPFTGGSISIGSKLSSTRHEQEIKGILTRELCRHAICLTYENTSHPYYKHDSTAPKKFNEIIQKINKSNDSGKSNEIIASIIRISKPDNIQMELIAAAVQILVQFDDDKEELTKFEVKFKILFDYFENFILPDLKNLNLKFRENVRNFNKTADILPNILSIKLELSELKDVKSLTENNFSLIQTNLPKLLLFNIQKCLQIDHGNLFNVKNVFVSAEKLKSQELLEDFKNLLAQDPNLNVFVICSLKIDENLKNIFACKSSKFTFIVSDDCQCQELATELEELNLNPTKTVINYGWNDLTVDSQKLLLQMKISFQNNSEFSFLDILKDEYNPEDEEVVRNFSEIVDDQFLSLMIEKSEISINLDLKTEKFDEKFFQERKFIKEELKRDSQYLSPPDWQPKVFYEKMSQEELLQDIQNAKFVLISDKPGSGKSWSMKNFAKILHKQNPTNWMTYVDLKQFAENFKDQMAQRRVSEFPTFFADTILRLKTKFEVEIFKKMYELGKVFIFLDGLDELTPSCAEFITKSAKLFESNEGSQLWIATRDHIEVDLEKILELDIKYKFDEFTEDDCVDLIATSWMMDGNKEQKADNENVSSYQKLAMDLMDKNINIKFGSIGMPQCCKMIAEITKDDKSSSIELTELKIYREFTQKLYRKWTESQENLELNFWTFHELMAMKILFPNYSDFNLENFKAWTDEMINAGGLITKNGQNFVFLHATICDFFVGEFILRNLKKEEVASWFFPFLLKVLTTSRYSCIRMFLNQGFNDLSELKLSDKTIKTITANIDEYTNISHVFMDNLKNLQKFLVMFLNRRRYKVVKSILVSNVDAIFSSIQKSEIPISPQIFLDFLVKFLNFKCLQTFIKEKKLFFKIIESCEDIEHFEKFANAVKLKLGAGFVVQHFKRHPRAESPNIFFSLCWSKNLDGPKVQKFLKILKLFLNVRKIMELMKVKSEWSSKNVLIESIKRGDPEVFKNFWTEIENFFKANESERKFKELVMHGVTRGQTILQTLVNSADIKLHETFWDLSVKTFGQEELKAFLNHEKLSFTNYFLETLMLYLENPQIIEFTFEKLQKIFNDEQFHEILTIKSYSGGHVLHRAAEIVKKFEIFELIWKIIKNFFKSDEKFLEYVCSLDNTGSNMLAAASKNNVLEIFDLIMIELKTIANHDEIKSLITNINNSSQNILHNINCQEIFSAVWIVISDYLNSSEMLELLQNIDCNGQNFILNMFYYHVYSSTVDYQELWNKVEGFINQHEVMSTEVIGNIEECKKSIQNFKELKYNLGADSDEFIKLKWLRTKNLRLLDCPETLRLEITQSGLFSCAYDIYALANCENFEIHEISWEFILKKYENREDLVKLMTKRSVHGSIFIHRIMSNKNIKVIDFILKIIQDNFNNAQIREILTIKCSNGVNLLSVAVRDSKNLQIVKILWEFYQKNFSSSENADLITQPSETSSNILLDAAGCSADIFNFIWNEVNRLCDRENHQKLVMQRNSCRHTIMHVCIEQHDIELIKIVWNEVKNFLGGSLKSIVRLVDVNSQYYEWYNDIVNILQLAITSDKIEFHEALWELLWDNFKEQDDLKSLILWKNDGQVVKVDEKVKKDDESSSDDDADLHSEPDNESQYTENYDNDKYSQDESEPYDSNEYASNSTIFYYLLQVFQSTNLDVIKLTMQNLDKILTKNEISKVLKFNKYDCFLENRSNLIEKHQLLWDVYRQYLTVTDLKKFSHRFFSRVLCSTATISIEIFKFTFNEVIKEAENILIPALEDDVHIISACIEHKDTDLLKFVWKEVENFYKIQNLEESYKEFVLKRRYDDSILHAASQINDVELHEALLALVLAAFENREELKNILIRKSEYYGCLIGDLFKNRDINVVKYLIKILEENFTDIQLQEVLSSESRMLQNCLNDDQNNFEIFQIWWEFFKKVFQKFAEFIEANENFNVIFENGSDKILELVFNDLKVLMTHEEIKKNFLKVNENNGNILHLALTRSNHSGKTYKFAWQYVHEYLSKQEILDLLNQTDKEGRNFLFYVVSIYSKEIVEITWEEIKKVLTNNDQIKCLKEKNPKDGNLYQCASKYSYQKDEILIWIESIFREYKIRINK